MSTQTLISPISATWFFKRSLIGLWRTLLLAWLFVLIGCGQDELPELDTAEILANSAEKMRSLAGFHFEIDRDGALAYLDGSRTLAFGSGGGDYVAPDRARAQVRIIAPGFVTTVSVISVGEIQWETNVVTGVWTELPPDWGFNPTVLFDPDVGIQSILTNDLSNIVQQEPVEIEGEPAYLISADVRGANLHQLSGFLIGPDDATIQLWIKPETFEMLRVQIVDPPDGDQTEDAIWIIDFSEFGNTLAIEPPVISEQ